MKKRKVAAVICEYNPFHEGHAWLFHSLRRELGEDTAIVAIMSGNFTQRGEPAVFPKQIRAACAVRGGADLVLELPFPFSSAGAERFASAGVYIANALGVVDILFFGSECGGIAPLLELAERLEAPAFLDAYFSVDEHAGIGCAQKTETAYKSVYGENDPLYPLLRQPNNLLGVEYIRALLRCHSSIRPFTLPHQGMKHGETEIKNGAATTSASAARQLFAKADQRDQALQMLPVYTRDKLSAAIKDGAILSSENRLLSFLLLYYRICRREELVRCDGMKGGLADRILRAASSAAIPEDFFAALRSKNHTDAYLRRALLYGMLSVNREQLNAPPAYTQILAMSERGKEVLAAARRKTAIPLFNRPSAIHQLPEGQKISLRADSIYSALLEQPSRPCDQLRYQPYRENT